MDSNCYFCRGPRCMKMLVVGSRVGLLLRGVVVVVGRIERLMESHGRRLLTSWLRFSEDFRRRRLRHRHRVKLTDSYKATVGDLSGLTWVVVFRMDVYFCHNGVGNLWAWVVFSWKTGFGRPFFVTRKVRDEDCYLESWTSDLWQYSEGSEHATNGSRKGYRFARG